MDPAEIREYRALVRDENLLYYTSLYMGSDDWRTNPDRPIPELLADVRWRLEHARAIRPSPEPADVQPRLRPLSHTGGPVNLVESPTQEPTYLNPGVSQDEIVIRQRGRRRLPETWSPIDLKTISFKSSYTTPPKTVPSNLPQQKVTTARKRLSFLERNPDISPSKMDFTDVKTPEKFKLTSPVKESPPSKRAKIESTPEKDCNSGRRCAQRLELNATD